jgi:teashirt-like protein
MNWAAAAAAAAGDSADGNVFKCTFCDTPFLSKGAYRHHLAKMHFVKEKSPQETPVVINNKEEPTINSSDSPASKFIKYTELAKQLSSK